jgi:DNA-directed RNA polymerase subunit RPC12/RpoP
MPNNPELFHSTIVPALDDSGKLFEERLDATPQPVSCLGKIFASDDERRAYFTEELHKKLGDPEFRKIEGFPIGKDEDILALSDPPYYTACPNPWLQDFISEWENQKDKSQARQPYHREPFAADVSEGKNDPIYNAHSYHTKVPHKAIMRYILHYTNPGDIVFDGFCGTGMTGVAAQMCGNRTEVESLGYKVEKDGTILQEETDEKGEKHWKAFSKLGARKAVLNDLSPAATFIAYNYNTPVDVAAFEKEAQRILAEVEAECGWMYETLHTDGKTKGKINYTVWSDVFVCPECSKEIIFWEAAVDKEAGEVRDEFPCTHCGAKLTKRRMERAWITKFDTAINGSVKQAKQVPVLMNYTANGKRTEKKPEVNDLALNSVCL